MIVNTDKYYPGKRIGNLFFYFVMISSLVTLITCLFQPYRSFLIKEAKIFADYKGKATAIKNFNDKLSKLNLKKSELNLQILIKKRSRKLILLHQDLVVATYPIALGKMPIGIKLNGTDNKTPEGDYKICKKDENWKYHLFLQLNYPGTDDAKRGAVQQLIMPSEEKAIEEAWKNNKIPPQNTAMGGPIGIQGFGAESNWTNGSIAMHNIHIEELYWNISTGTPVAIVP